MADNIQVAPSTSGSAVTVATDDIGGVQVQRVKLMIGADGANDGDISKINPLPVYFPGVTYTDRSGTITAGGAAQQLAAANASRKGFFIQNNSTVDLWINSVTTAVLSQPSLKIVAGALYESPANGVPVTAISIIGAATAQAFSAREW